MSTYGTYGATKAEALRASDDERPSLLPDGNRWKVAVEDHRWGRHHTHTPGCPACERKEP